MKLIGFRAFLLEEHTLYEVSIKTSREEIVVLPDWSAYHEHSGRGSITSSRPTVLSFQLLFNYANCPPPSPGLLRFASRPGERRSLSWNKLRGFQTNRARLDVIIVTR